MSFLRWLGLPLLVWVVGCQGAVPPIAGTPAPAAPEAAEETPPVFSLAAAVSNEDDETNVVSSRITKVTVYSDRALVTRRGQVALSGEPVVHRFKHLPGWVDDGSVRAATSAGKIVDVSVERRFLARSTDEGFRKVELAHKAMLQKLQALDDELAILEAKKKQIEGIEVFSREKLSTDAVTRDIRVDSYGQVVEYITNTLRQTAAARREAEAERERLTPDVEASARNLEELRRLTTLEETTVLVTLQGSGAADATLTLTYATPGATWEPAHEMRVSSEEPNAVALTSFAVVTQTTGEDWNQAELSFSTSSSSDPERIPELEMLALGKTESVTKSRTKRVSSFSRAQQAYAEQNMFWNRMNQAPTKNRSEIERFEKSYSSNLEYFEKVQNKTVEIFQGLAQRGTNVHFVAKDPAIVRSDGRPIRLAIGGRTIKAKRDIVAAPEESLNAALTLEMTNSGDQPLLPGGVARYQDGAFLGMTDVDFVARGETFSLFYSVADEVKLARKLDRKRSSLVRKARNRMQLSFVTSAHNLSKREVKLVLAERVPVSENSEVRVSNVRITPNQRPDNQGIVRWSLTLAPGEKRELRVSYQIDYPPSLVLDVQRKRESAPRSPSPSPMKRPIEDQIFDFEQHL